MSGRPLCTHAFRPAVAARPRRTAVAFAASADSLGSMSTSAPGPASASDAVSKSAERVGGLQAKILLRKLYRNLLRAEPLLELPSPVYQPPEEAPPLDPGAANAMDLATAAAAAEDEAQRRVDDAVDIVAEMELTAEELRVSGHSLLVCLCLYVVSPIKAERSIMLDARTDKPQ